MLELESVCPMNPISCSVTGEELYHIRPRRHRLRVSTVPVGVTRTIESVAYESDIAAVVEKYKRTGRFDSQPIAPEMYADVSGLNSDLTELINQSADALTGAAHNDSQVRAANAEAEAKRQAEAREAELESYAQRRIKEHLGRTE